MEKKVFISYSWSKKETEIYVVELAKKLARYGEVDIILDKIALKVGHKMDYFMETSVKTADKVLIICDESYKEKADLRERGAGTETQIISPQVYKSATQTKFMPIYIDSEENAPTYLSGRLGVKVDNYDLSEEKIIEIMKRILEIEEIELPKIKKSFLEEIKEQKSKKEEMVVGVEERLYKHFFETFEGLCDLKNWSQNISGIVTPGPRCRVEVINNFEKFILYTAKFNFSTKEKFKKFNVEIQIFFTELNKMKNIFLEHTIIDTQHEWYIADRFYRNGGMYNSNYDKDLQEYNKWEEELEKYISNLTYSLTRISEVIREDIDDTFMLYEGKFSYMSGPHGFMEYYEIIPISYIDIDEQENKMEEVKLSSLSIKSLVGYITGDLKRTPNKSGPQLIEFFNNFGKRDAYSWEDGGLPGKLSRKQFVENYLNDFNNTKELKKIIESIVDTRGYIGTDFNLKDVVNEMNQILTHDNYKLISENEKYKLTFN